MNNIYLVGFMGTGKTSVGYELAKKIKQQFIDLDSLIELREKKLIADIFAEKGEPYFRKVEKQALKEVAKEKGFVVATGGGIVINPENIKIMKETGMLICLSASPEVILKRVSGLDLRPLMNVKDPKKQIELLLKLRAPYYALAGKTIDTSKLSVGRVVQNIIKVISKRGSKR
ncbi:MAG: shikimate kinase [Candidatus Omnitrophica bacterium]|jgi:shikimate kinase|nr:shikimate kinase [Candidatus Omnitrophota bacterium]